MFEVTLSMSNDDMQRIKERLSQYCETLVKDMTHPTDGNKRSASATTTYVMCKQILRAIRDHEQTLASLEEIGHGKHKSARS